MLSYAPRLTLRRMLAPSASSFCTTVGATARPVQMLLLELEAMTCKARLQCVLLTLAAG